MSSESGHSIDIRDLWKTFQFFGHPFHRFLFWGTRGRRGAPQLFHALRGLTFEVSPGTSTGIIGANGAGKSTLLKIITGVLEPTRGMVRLQGRVASLLELGTGFHPLFTGRQNIVYNARFLGLTDDEIRARLPEIEAFSELGPFLDRPLRTYSSGMHVRLAFSVAASVSPDILVVDEVLAVGDAYFQQKCIRRIRDFRDRGVTILFVSHDPSAVTTLCDRGLLLHQGEIVDDGPPPAVLQHYNALIARKKAESDYFSAEAGRASGGARRSGSFEALITEVELLDASGLPARALLAASEATIRVRVLFLTHLENPTVGVLIRDRLGNDVYGTNTYYQQIPTGAWHPGESVEVRFRLELALGPGEYSLSAAVHSFGVHVLDSYDWLDATLLFRMLPADARLSIGTAYLRPRIETARAPQVASPAETIRTVLGEIPDALSMAADDGAMLRTGWYAAEGVDDDAFRWTHEACTLLLSLSGSRLCCEAGVSRPAGAPPVEVRVVSLGRELGRFQLDPRRTWQQIELPLAPDVPRGPAHLRLSVGDTWRPADTGHSLDGRTLGIRVRRIWSAA